MISFLRLYRITRSSGLRKFVRVISHYFDIKYTYFPYYTLPLLKTPVEQAFIFTMLTTSRFVSSSSSSSSSSSPSSPNSLLPESRASTPASELLLSDTPDVYAYIPAAYLNSNVLKTVFEKHSSNGTIAVIFDNVAIDSTNEPTDEFRKNQWTSYNVGDAEYLVSTSGNFKLCPVSSARA